MSQSLNNDIAAGRAFDSIARRYDIEFDSSPIARKQRQQIYTLIESLVKPPSRILDINCGTGTDAIALAEKGFTLVGVDVSVEMIAESRRKSAGRSDVEFALASFEALTNLDERTFDLVFSNFGGLNCAPSLDTVSGQVAARLKPNGYFIAVLMPPFSLWETSAFVAQGQMKQAFRRMGRRGTKAEFDGNAFTVFYFTPGKAARQLANHFVVREVYAWNIFSPPPHAWRSATTVPRVIAQLERLDRAICHLPFFRSIGDHYVMVLQKRPQ